MSEVERSLQAQIAAHESWANTEDRTARTAPARRALDQKFLDAADGDPIRAAHLKKAYYLRLALKSAQSRRQAKEGRQVGKQGKLTGLTNADIQRLGGINVEFKLPAHLR